VVDALQRSVVTTIPLPRGAEKIDIRGSLAYVTLPDANQVGVVDLNANLLVKTINVGRPPADIDIATSQPLALVTNLVSDDISIINTNIAQSSPNTITIGSFPGGISFTPNGRRAYAANQVSDTLSVIDVIRHTQILTIPVGSGPFGVKVNSNGRLVVVSNADSNTLSIIDTTLNQVIGTVPVGTLPLYLAILDLGV